MSTYTGILILTIKTVSQKNTRIGKIKRLDK